MMMRIPVVKKESVFFFLVDLWFYHDPEVGLPSQLLSELEIVLFLNRRQRVKLYHLHMTDHVNLQTS